MDNDEMLYSSPLKALNETLFGSEPWHSSLLVLMI